MFIKEDNSLWSTEIKIHQKLLSFGDGRRGGF